MKKALIFFSILLSGVCSFGQNFEKGNWKDKKGSVDYSYYNASGNTECLFLVFVDQSTSVVNVDSVLRSLVPVANAKNATLMLPRFQNPLIENQFGNWLNAINVGGKPVRYVALSDGVFAALNLASINGAGVLVRPNLSEKPKLVVNSSDPLIAIVSEEELPIDSPLLDSLNRIGYWIKFENSSSLLARYSEVLVSQLNWLDSMQVLLDDSVESAILRAKSGWTSKIPEVLCQGQTLELDLFAANQGEYIVQVLNLNARPVFYKVAFLGKGSHHFEVPTKSFDWGVYHIEVIGPSVRKRDKFMIRG
jgi:hypothetical protein